MQWVLFTYVYLYYVLGHLLHLDPKTNKINSIKTLLKVIDEKSNFKYQASIQLVFSESGIKGQQPLYAGFPFPR